MKPVNNLTAERKLLIRLLHFATFIFIYRSSLKLFGVFTSLFQTASFMSSFVIMNAEGGFELVLWK